MQNASERIANAVIVIVAITVAVAVVHREFFAQPRIDSRIGAPARAPERVPNWGDLVSSGNVIGDSLAQVKIVEFGDFECPYCRNMETGLKHIREEFGNKVAVVFVEFPLTQIHRFAEPAARAAECAGEQASFAAYHDLLYEKQDSLGLKSWASFATEAGVRDTARFDACVRSRARVPRIEQGLAVGNKLGVGGTPTLVVDGLEFFSPPADNTLERVISTSLAHVGGATPSR